MFLLVKSVSLISVLVGAVGVSSVAGVVGGSSISTENYARSANQYMTCGTNVCQMYSSTATSAIDCTLMCNKEASCRTVNYNRGSATCELLSSGPSQLGAVSDTQWAAYHKTGATCEENWVQYGDHCYFYNTVWAKWGDSERYCNMMDASLVDISDDGENQFVYNFAKSHSTEDVWIGLNDKDVDNVWKWSSGVAFTYEKFANGEPSNDSNGDEPCVASLSGGTHEWNDHPCRMNHPSVCKRPV